MQNIHESRISPASGETPARACGLLGAFAMPWRVALPLLLVAAVLAIPSVDLTVSHWVYAPEKGGFWIGHSLLIDVLGEITSYASTAFLLAVFGWWLVGQRVFRRAFRIPDRFLAYLLLAFLMGPVLTVSLGFKEHWGRNRPVEVTEFGGTERYTPYYMPTGVCVDDCSFPSGHSSRGFFFMALAIAAYGLGWKHRRAILVSALAFGFLTAGLRILEGRHFLSDVTMAGVIVTYIAWVTFRLVYHRKIKAGE